MQAFCQRIVITRAFEYLIVALILISAVVLGLETSPLIMAEYGGVF
ncbi:MAG TPA: ion transporter, partial [Gammaproteobacteria bacterium]|nr:ion transporter [Gammaproteobacteria bacterium]